MSALCVEYVSARGQIGLMLDTLEAGVATYDEKQRHPRAYRRVESFCSRYTGFVSASGADLGKGVFVCYLFVLLSQSFFSFLLAPSLLPNSVLPD